MSAARTFVDGFFLLFCFGENLNEKQIFSCFSILIVKSSWLMCIIMDSIFVLLTMYMLFLFSIHLATFDYPFQCFDYIFEFVLCIGNGTLFSFIQKLKFSKCRAYRCRRDFVLRYVPPPPTNRAELMEDVSKEGAIRRKATIHHIGGGGTRVTLWGDLVFGGQNLLPDWCCFLLTVGDFE